MSAAAAAKSLQSCPTLCDSIDGSPPGSPVPGILQARTLEWVAISFSNAWKWKVKVKSLSRVRPSATPWTAAFQAPPSMGFSRQEYWSGVPFYVYLRVYFYFFHWDSNVFPKILDFISFINSYFIQTSHIIFMPCNISRVLIFLLLFVFHFRNFSLDLIFNSLVLS